MDEQIAYALKQAEFGTSVPESCHKLGIAEKTFYRWRSKYTGMLPSDLKQLKQREEENSKLKKMVVDLSLDKIMLPEYKLVHAPGGCERKAGKMAK